MPMLRAVTPGEPLAGFLGKHKVNRKGESAMKRFVYGLLVGGLSLLVM